MQHTQLDNETCAKVWELSNSHGSEIFTKSMFLIAMHLMYKKRANPDLEVPNDLPIELFRSAHDFDEDLREPDASIAT